MQFAAPLVRGRFLRRYKRFFVDVELSDGAVVVAHCPNTGALTGCLVEGAQVLLEPASNPARSLRYTWKFVHLDGWVGVDTGLAVPLVERAIASGVLPGLGGFERVYREVKYGRDGGSRIDLLLSRGGVLPANAKPRTLPEGDERVYVEVKNTTLVEPPVALFPDAVTERGQKHLEELVHVRRSGQRAAMVYCVQRGHVSEFRPAALVDPRYAQLLSWAALEGVELYALRAVPSERGIESWAEIPVVLTP
jgi:sugar fermentation stimulation protein A